ncbi:MAG: class I SAM-dependent methyltransferase [Candidatus Binataceae bacterium]
MIAAYFGRLAKSYGEGVYYARRRVAVIAAVARELRDARSILDLGCGNGAYLAELCRLCQRARIVGADLSPEMLAEARRRAGTGVHLVQADAGALPFGTESFDLVLCSHVLQLVADLSGCVSGVARCLRPGGVLIATLQDSSVRERLRAAMTAEQWEDFARTVFREIAGRRPARTAEAYSEAYRSAGLELESRSAPFSVGWTDVEEFVRIRWMPVASEQGRREMERMSARLRADTGMTPQTFELREGILLGRNPGAPPRARSARV